MRPTFQTFSLVTALLVCLGGCTATSSVDDEDDTTSVVDPDRRTDTSVARPDVGSTTETDTGTVIERDTGTVVTDTGSVDTDTGTVTTDTGTATTDTGSVPDTSTGYAVGSSCTCDTDCAGTATHPGACFNGVCLQIASGACSGSGVCPSGTVCVSTEDESAHYCAANCDTAGCAGDCIDTGVGNACVYALDSVCDETCSEACGPPHNGEEPECPPNARWVSGDALLDDGCYCEDYYVVNDAGDACEAGIDPGGLCNCSDDCGGPLHNPGVCVSGICIMLADADCSYDGSTLECPGGSRCWGGGCWPDCGAYACAGTCDAESSCVPDETTSCDGTCSDYCE